MATYNFTLADLFVQIFASEGIEHIFISPGSRSTPLTLAFAKNSEKFSINVVYDERSAAFQALGCALATNKPTALVCTSGSAVANYLPAVVEANQSEVPLLILTADRPFELQDSGANQTIPQLGIFGKFVKKSLEMPVGDNPEWMEEGKLRRFLRIRASYVIALAKQKPQGPIHINFPFRKPLEPRIEELNIPKVSKTIHFQMGNLVASKEQIEKFEELLSNSEKPLLVLGPNTWREAEIQMIERFASHFEIPIFSDILSGRRVTPHEHFLQSEKIRKRVKPDLIIHLGKVPIGNGLNRLIEESTAIKVQISASLRLQDDVQKTSYFFYADPGSLLKKISKQVRTRVDSKWAKLISNLEHQTMKFLKNQLTYADFEGAFVGKILNSIDRKGIVFLGNSLSVRHAMYYGMHCEASIFGNRGASGIDGNISTALGLYKGLQKHVIAIVGDLTFIHDLNALTDKDRKKITVIIINNQGGGIFRRLPISEVEEFPKFFLTPHTLTFEKIAEFYGMKYQKFTSKLPSSENLKPGTIIEIMTDSAKDAKKQKEIVSEICRFLEASFD